MTKIVTTQSDEPANRIRLDDLTGSEEAAPYALMDEDLDQIGGAALASPTIGATSALVISEVAAAVANGCCCTCTKCGCDTDAQMTL